MALPCGKLRSSANASAEDEKSKNSITKSLMPVGLDIASIGFSYCAKGSASKDEGSSLCWRKHRSKLPPCKGAVVNIFTGADVPIRTPKGYHVNACLPRQIDRHFDLIAAIIPSEKDILPFNDRSCSTTIISVFHQNCQVCICQIKLSVYLVLLNNLL